jgi:anti-sigma regulatory factor (Ser/Thr protein kinase)
MVMNDEIRLVVPAEEDFRPIVHLVVGGLAVRLDLTMDALEDLQVALDALLSERDDEGDVEVRVAFDEQTMRASVGPLPAAIRDDVERDGNELGLRRVLETVCDTFEIEDRDGETWVELSKQTAAPTRAGS